MAERQSIALMFQKSDPYIATMLVNNMKGQAHLVVSCEELLLL